MIYVNQEIVEFTSSNIVDTVSLYSELTSYNVGDYARAGNSVYKSTATSNIGHHPEVNAGVYWIKWSPSNTYSLLDLEQDTITTWVGDGTVTFTRGSKDSIGIGNYIASSVKIEYLDAIGEVLYEQNFITSKNLNVYDEWDYGYAGFTSGEDGIVFTPILRIGVSIRVTFFAAATGGCSCGFIVAGKQISMGATKDEVSFPDKRIGSKTISVANFQTVVQKKDLMRKSNEAKSLINTPMMFVIDESSKSSHNNMIILGKIMKCDAVGANSPINFISWEVEQFTQGAE